VQQFHKPKKVTKRTFFKRLTPGSPFTASTSSVNDDEGEGYDRSRNKLTAHHLLVFADVEFQFANCPTWKFVASVGKRIFILNVVFMYNLS
jgi:hypothetical protein